VFKTEVITINKRAQI